MVHYRQDLGSLTFRWTA